MRRILLTTILVLGCRDEAPVAPSLPPTPAVPQGASPETPPAPVSPVAGSTAPVAGSADAGTVARPAIPSLVEPSCAIAECEGPDDARVAAEEGFAALRTDPVRTACLSRRAIRIADQAGNADVAGAAFFNLGKALESLGCGAHALWAYRASRCRRPGASAAVTKRLDARCRAVDRAHSGACTVCPEGGEPPPARAGTLLGHSAEVSLSPGDLLSVDGDLTLTLTPPQGPPVRVDPAQSRRLTVGGAEVEVLFFRGGDGEDFVVVVRRTPSVRKVIGILVDSVGGNADRFVEHELLDGGRRARVFWSYDRSGRYDIATRHVEIGVSADRVWLVSEDLESEPEE